MSPLAAVALLSLANACGLATAPDTTRAQALIEQAYSLPHTATTRAEAIGLRFYHNAPTRACNLMAENPDAMATLYHLTSTAALRLP